MNKEKGAMEIGTVAIGLYAAAVLAMFGINFNIDMDQTEKLSAQGERITSTEGKVSRIPYLEGKLDRILEAQRINPADVEREVERQLNLKTATTVPPISNTAKR